LVVLLPDDNDNDGICDMWMIWNKHEEKKCHQRAPRHTVACQCGMPSLLLPEGGVVSTLTAPPYTRTHKHTQGTLKAHSRHTQGTLKAHSRQSLTEDAMKDCLYHPFLVYFRIGARSHGPFGCVVGVTTLNPYYKKEYHCERCGVQLCSEQHNK
jgi:hypothetical protein